MLRTWNLMDRSKKSYHHTDLVHDVHEDSKYIYYLLNYYWPSHKWAVPCHPSGRRLGPSMTWGLVLGRPDTKLFQAVPGFFCVHWTDPRSPTHLDSTSQKKSQNPCYNWPQSSGSISKTSQFWWVRKLACEFESHERVWKSHEIGFFLKRL